MKILPVFGPLNGLTAVALGAFGAHQLKTYLEASQTLDLWHTAVFYHLTHAILIQAALWAGSAVPLAFSRLQPAILSWSLGVILFSGSLYSLALGGPKFLVYLTPLGGFCLLVGWALALRPPVRNP